MSWRETLKKLLELFTRSSEDKELVLIGVGNTLRGDDAVGVEIVRELESKLKSENLRILTVEDRVDLIPDLLKRTNPSLILVFDAADFGGNPGEVRIMSPAESSGKTTSTHELPLELMLRLAEVSAPAYVVGIQIMNLGIGEGMSPPVREAVDEIVKFLMSILCEAF